MPLEDEFDRIHHLRNGLKIAVLPFAKKTRVYLWLFVETGSWDGFIPASRKNPETPKIFVEWKGKSVEFRYSPGIDHGTEHMVFKGTLDPKFKTPLRIVEFFRPRNRDDEEAHSAGSYDPMFYVYNTEVEPPEVELALRFLGALTLRSLLNRNDLATQKRLGREWEKDRRAIHHEWGMGYDEMHLLNAVERTRMQMFPGHPLGYSIEGTKEDFLSLTLPEITQRYRLRYHPSNMLLVVIGGGFSPQKIKKLAEKYFRAPRRKVPKIKVPPPRISLVIPLPERIVFRPEPAVKVYMTIGFPFTLPPALSGEEISSHWLRKHLTLAVFKKVFGGRWASRTFVELREKRGIGYRHHAFLEEYPGAGALIYATHLFPDKVYPGEIWKALRLLLHIFKGFTKKPLPSPELEDAKKAVIDELGAMKETPSDLAEFICFWSRFTGKVPLLEDLKQEIETVTAEDVLRLAQEIIRPERVTAVFSGDIPDEKAQNSIRRMFGCWKV